MKHFNIAFVGMGSIGKRHLKNICQVLERRSCTYAIDLYRSSLNNELPEEIQKLVEGQYLCDASILKNYDIVFVTNPTSLHLKTIENFANHAGYFFVEKPIFNTPIEINEVLATMPIYVACPLRYNPVLQYIKRNVDKSKVVAVRAMSSSYLPDWRPGQDYRKTYSAHKDLGGGVDIDLIHEWDYLTWIFGMPTTCSGIVGKYSNLEIDSNDTALYIASNERMTYELHLDYFGRKTQRTLEIFTTDDTVHCDIVNGSITFLKEDRNITFESERNCFQIAEIEHFLDIVEGAVANDSNISHAVKVLYLTKMVV